MYPEIFIANISFINQDTSEKIEERVIHLQEDTSVSNINLATKTDISFLTDLAILWSKYQCTFPLIFGQQIKDICRVIDDAKHNNFQCFSMGFKNGMNFLYTFR